MNEHVDFERSVATHIASEGVNPPSDAFYDELFDRAADSRQRPEWLALLKEKPMRTNSRLAVGSPTARVAAVLVATFLLAVALAGVGVAGQRLLAANAAIIVAADGSGDHTTISHAVAAAQDGDEILVRPGTYEENIRVTRDVTIAGDGDADTIVVRVPDQGLDDATVFDGMATKYAFYLDDTSASVGNLTVSTPNAGFSAFIVDGGAPTIHDVILDQDGLGTAIPRVFAEVTGSAAGTIRDNKAAAIIHVDEGSTPVITGNISRSSEEDGDLLIVWTSGSGSDAIIRDNFVNAIWIHDGSAPQVEVNDISGTVGQQGPTGPIVCGIELGETSGAATIANNTIHANKEGICVHGDTAAVISDNDFADNAFGIATYDGEATILGNSFERNETAIRIRGSGVLDVNANTIEGNDRGLVVEAGATPAEVRYDGNTICGNGSNMVLIGEAAAPDPARNEICEDSAA